MIRLDPLAIERFDFLSDKYKPTHAHAVSHSVSNIGARGILCTYWFGTLNADGMFVQTDQAAIVTVHIPNALLGHASPEDSETLINNLLGADVAPDPANPLQAIPVPGKREGDWKLQDVDAICAWAHPDLKGTVE
jgi:hypothetical protein